MKKKLLYGIIFLTIFLMSSISTAQPVQGYEFGVPKEAKGLETEGEIMFYDEDEWEEHLGKDADEPDDYFGGDADKVGAKSKTKVLDWEKDEDLIDFFADFVLKAEQEVENIPEIEDFNGVFDYIKNSTNGLGDPNGASNVVHLTLFAANGGGIIPVLAPGVNFWLDQVYANGTLANNTCNDYSFDSEFVNEKYAEKLDGIVLEREIWKYTDEQYDKKPDTKGKDADAPFLADPRDWHDTYKKLDDVKNELLNNIQNTVDNIMLFNQSLIDLREKDSTTISWALWTDLTYWEWINATIALGIMLAPPTGLGLPLPTLGQGGGNLPWLVLEAGLKADGTNYLQNGTKGLFAVRDLVGSSIPGKFGFLYNLLLEGLPIYTPIDDFLAKIVEEFDIDDENLETAIPGLDPTIQVYGDVEVEGGAITLKFEYPDDTVDPADPDEELKDWEVTFTYGDTGSQASVVFKDDDGEEFYRKEGLPMDYLQIPLISNIIIVAGITTGVVIVGVIYVIMRKRRR